MVEPAFVFGWDEEKLLAWRHPAASPSSVEFSLRPTLADDADPSAELICKFGDGSSHTVSGLSNQQFKELDNKNRGGQNKRLFETVSKTSHQAIWIAQRWDRNWLLISIYDAGKQIAQVKAALFGDLPGEQPAIVPNDYAAVQTAFGHFAAVCGELGQGQWFR